MAHPVSLSKSKLLSYLQCPRRLWLEQYSPELEEPSREVDSLLETGRVVGEMARQIYGAGGGQHISQQRGLRHAIEQTSALMAAGSRVPLFEATFEHDGVVALIDVFDLASTPPRLIEVKAATSVKERHIDDCAIQAWILESLGHHLGAIVVANIDNQFVYRGDGDYSGLLAETDVAEVARDRASALPEIVAGARATLQSLDEPETSVGAHCTSDHTCPFYEHCLPAQGRYPVAGLGGRKSRIYDWIRAGHGDLRDVPESELAGDTQQRIWRQTRLEAPYIGARLHEFIAELCWPRFYLDFETIAFAVPIWEGTRPYEALPFQWSCHIENEQGASAEPRLEHRQYLNLTGAPPMRECAEALIDAVGSEGPILVYTSYERTVINGLAKRYPDLAGSLEAISDRLVDLHPIVKAEYYHPDMLGSWSIKAVLPTIDAGLDYGELGSVQDGMAAQTAFLEAIAPATSDERREQLGRDLLEYCRYDTLAMFKLVEHFSGARVA